MFVQALLIGLWAGIAGVDMFDGLTHIHRPIVTGLVVGLILGDMKTGLIVGASLELVWMGMVPLSGAQPPNVVIGGIIGTSIAILGKLDAQAAIGIAVPFAVAVQAAITLLFTAFSFFMHKADKYCEDADTAGIERINYLGLVVLFIFYFTIAFLPILLGADKAAAIVMLKKEYVGFMILGFLLVTYFNLPILGLALLGVCIALYDYFSKNNSDSREKVVEEVYDDGI